MAGFDIGKFISGIAGNGIENGLKQGLKYLQEDKQLTVWAIRTGNLAALEAIAHVDALFLQETVGIAVNPTGLLGDPTSGSRHALQAVYDKYGADCAAWWSNQGK